MGNLSFIYLKKNVLNSDEQVKTNQTYFKRKVLRECKVIKKNIK